MEHRRILRQPDAAQYLALAESTLEKLRGTGGGPRFVKLGARAVGYDVHDLDAWVEGQKRTSTSDAGPA
jgi:predicted DNA-binding transcriptional regulator AlpA